MKEKFKVSKDFILEAHKSACPTFKTKIENQFPELFPKVDVGKWKTPLNEYEGIALCCVQNPNDTNNFGYGFDFLGNWVDKGYTVSKEQEVRFATKEEVETALIAEAKKRGYKDGVVCNCIDMKKNKKISNHSYFVYNSIYNYMYCGGVRVFENGKWAEIISEPIELSLDEIAEKFGVDVSLIKIKK